MRRIAMVGMVLAFVAPASGKVYWGVRAGISRTSIVQKVDLDYRSGWNIGGSVAGLVDIPIYERFSFRPEVSFVYQGGSFLSGYDESPLYSDIAPHSVFSEFYRLRNETMGYSLQVPLNLAFNIPISGVKMAVYGGPALDFRLHDKVTTKVIEDHSAVAAPKIKPFDLCINSGISVEYKKVFFSIDVLSGTFDRRVEKIKDESSVFQNNITFSLGYIFR
jgi:hypothetical protein